jgi:hypothetical protein
MTPPRCEIKYASRHRGTSSLFIATVGYPFFDATVPERRSEFTSPVGPRHISRLAAGPFEENLVAMSLYILADRDEVAVGITHAATPFSAVIVQRLGKKDRSFVAPLFGAGP